MIVSNSHPVTYLIEESTWTWMLPHPKDQYQPTGSHSPFCFDYLPNLALVAGHNRLGQCMQFVLVNAFSVCSASATMQVFQYCRPLASCMKTKGFTLSILYGRLFTVLRRSILESTKSVCIRGSMAYYHTYFWLSQSIGCNFCYLVHCTCYLVLERIPGTIVLRERRKKGCALRFRQIKISRCGPY